MEISTSVVTDCASKDNGVKKDESKPDQNESVTIVSSVAESNCRRSIRHQEKRLSLPAVADVEVTYDNTESKQDCQISNVAFQVKECYCTIFFRKS